MKQTTKMQDLLAMAVVVLAYWLVNLIEQVPA